MSEFGKFSEITFVDGTSPPINADNLNELERVVALTDSELARSDSVKFSEWSEYFFERNTNVLFYFTDYSSWTNHYPANGSLSDEQSNNLIGNDALKMEIINAVAGWMSISQTKSTVDLAKFFDGSASTTSDILVIYFYVSDSAAFDDLEFRFGDDFGNSYHLDVGSGFSTGWNAIYPQKSDFNVIGAPTGWNDITYLRIAPHSVAGNVGEYMYFQHLGIIRQDPVYSGYCNPFQKYMGAVTGWENLFAIANDTIIVYRDYQDMIEKIGFMKLDGQADNTELRIYDNILEFISKFEFYCKYAGESASINWYADSNNHAVLYISSDTFYLDVTEGGVLTQTSQALDNSLIKNERFYIYFEKQLDTFRGILIKDGESITILEYETSISADTDGYIFLGQNTSNSYSFLTDFEIGRKPIGKLPRELLPRLVRMQAEQTFTNNTITNVLGLVANLAPNSFYKVDLFVVAACNSATPDIKIAWELTNCQAYTYRCCQGPPTNTTNVDDTNIRSSEYGITTELSYGCESGGSETFIKETSIILSQYDAGKIQIKAAQNNTDAGNPTTIKSRSYMIITPLDAMAHTNL